MKTDAKVGCVLAVRPNHNNYGTSLQAYATIRVIRSLGYTPEVIRYKKQRSIWEIIKIAFPVLRSGGMTQIRRMIRKKINFFLHRSYKTNTAIRTKTINAFKKVHFEPYIKTYEGYPALCKGSSNYDVVMVGSDQVWNPISLYSRFYNLLFVDEHIPTFSYASSFGVSDIPSWQLEGTAEYLNRINEISVRELRAREIVKELTGKDALVAMDPTLLLTREEWIKFGEDSKCKIDEPYIFCYILGKRPEIREEITLLKAKTGMKVVYLRHVDDFVKIDEEMGDYAPYDISPVDFVSLLSNAKYVCTDSFHGTLFSIIFERQFVTFYRVDPRNSKSTHSRINSIFAITGLQSRIADRNITDKIRIPIDYSQVNQRIGALRAKSLEFLNRALQQRKSEGND